MKEIREAITQGVTKIIGCTIKSITTTNNHSSLADPFNCSNEPKLACRYSDHAAE
jgi:hypothetical protein